MDEAEKILRSVLARVRPSAGELRKDRAMARKIISFIKKEFNLEADIMGSVAKNTFIAGHKDLDVFVFFPTKTPREELEKRGLEIGRAVFDHFGGRYQVKYAEHPYTNGFVNTFHIEIVPAYKVRSGSAIRSAVDRTPFHKAYVMSKLKKHDEVRLLKQFLIGVGCYGSDLKKEGFSGYLCELLIIRHGSFRRLIEEAQSWKYQEVLHLKADLSKEAKKGIRGKFRWQPFVVIDPVDKNRNVAAALSREKYARFIFMARRFAEEPSEEFFFPLKKRIDKKSILDRASKRHTELVAVCFDRPDAIDDILYPQMRRFRSLLAKTLTRNGFTVLDSWVFANSDCGVGLEVQSTRIPRFSEIKGPSVYNPVKHQMEFVRRHEKVWFNEDRFVAEAERRHNELKPFLKELLSGSEKELREKGVPSTIARSMSSRWAIVKGDALKRIKSDEFWKGVEKETVS